MIIEFETHLEGLGDAIRTDDAPHEVMEYFCVALAREVDRLRKEHARILEARSAGFGDTPERKLAWAIIGLLGGADRTTALDALVLAIAGLLGSDDRMSPRDVTRFAARIGTEIAKDARSFRKAARSGPVGKSDAQH